MYEYSVPGTCRATAPSGFYLSINYFFVMCVSIS